MPQPMGEKKYNIITEIKTKNVKATHLIVHVISNGSVQLKILCPLNMKTD